MQLENYSLDIKVQSALDNYAYLSFLSKYNSLYMLCSMYSIFLFIVLGGLLDFLLKS